MISVVVKLVSNPFGSNGISSGPTLLQTGQGAPAPPQPQAFGPSHGRSGWFTMRAGATPAKSCRTSPFTAPRRSYYLGRGPELYNDSGLKPR